jgi:hypothetical protein
MEIAPPALYQLRFKEYDMKNNYQDGLSVTGMVKRLTPSAWIGIGIAIVFTAPILQASASGVKMTLKGISMPVDVNQLR